MMTARKSGAVRFVAMRTCGLSRGAIGAILNASGATDELVKNIIVGAMSIDSALSFLSLKSDKAVITRVDRPDIQLAALETSTKCLVLSGSKEPSIYNVFQKAENRGIPIISTDNSTDDIVTSIENALIKSRFSQEKKLPKLAEIMKQHLDLQAVL